MASSATGAAFNHSYAYASTFCGSFIEEVCLYQTVSLLVFTLAVEMFPKVAMNFTNQGLNYYNTWRLHEAIAQGDVQSVRKLLNSGIYLSRKNRFGLTPIEQAMKAPINLEIVELLLEHKAPIDVKAEEVKAVFFLAVVKKKPNLVKLLLERQFDPNTQDKMWRSPLFYALESGSIEILELLLKHGAHANIDHENDDFDNDWPPLLIAVNLKKPEMVRLLLEYRADVNGIIEKCEWGPLQLAAKIDSLEIVKLLLDHKADINGHNYANPPPLYYALENGNLNMADFLHKRGADVNADNMLHKTTQLGNFVAVKFLLDHGVTIDAKDDDGNTAMHLAVMVGNQSIIELLMANGARCDIQNKKGEQPEDLTKDETLLNIFWNIKTLASKGSED